MIERSFGRPRTRADVEDRLLVEIPRDSKPVSRCHPDRPMYAVGLCQHCYAEVVRHRQRTADAQLLGSPTEGWGTPLTDRHRRILDLLAEGHTNKTAAIEMGISEQTVKNHMSLILRKLGAQGAGHAIALHLEARYGALDETAAALEYLGHVERNLLRLRRDVTNVIGGIRKARAQAAAPAPATRLELVQVAGETIVRNRFRNRGDRCKRDHLFTKANTRITAKGGRHCRSCARDKNRDLGQRQRDALRALEVPA